MKIALSFPGCHRRGGVERVMLECANFLAGRDHEVHIVAADIDQQALHPAVNAHEIRLRPNIRLLNLLTFSRNVRRSLDKLTAKPDVSGAFGIHCPHDGVLWVQSVHRAWLEISRKRRNWRGRLKQRLNLAHPLVLALEERYFGRRNYRKLIALTQQVKQDLIRFYSVPDEDIEILPNGFSAAEFNWQGAQQCRADMRESLGIHPDEKAVIFVANELERKGFWPLVHAIASLPDPNIKLIVAGRASIKSGESELRRLKMFDRVVAVGSSSNVAKYYAAADVFALPTQYEAWGLVIIEAMACGLPVLTSRLAGAAIAVKPGLSGELLENPDDTVEIAVKLQRLLQERYDSPETISASVTQYEWAKVLEKYERILLDCAVPRKIEPASPLVRPQCV